MQQRLARRVAYQAELFESESDQPSWRELPARTRDAVTSLVAQLLSERGRLRRTRSAEEGEHE